MQDSFTNASSARKSTAVNVQVWNLYEASIVPVVILFLDNSRSTEDTR